MTVAAAAEPSASAVKGGVVLFSELKALMQALAKALLNALDTVLVLLMINRPKINDSGERRCDEVDV